MLGAFLRGLRGDRRADEVASAIGVVTSAVYLWESDGETSPRRPVGHRRRPSAKHLAALLDLYGATPEQRLRAWELTALPRTEAGAA